MKAQRKFEILSSVLYLDPDYDLMTDVETFDKRLILII